jgi:hypothetical protein
MLTTLPLHHSSCPALPSLRLHPISPRHFSRQRHEARFVFWGSLVVAANEMTTQLNFCFFFAEAWGAPLELEGAVNTRVRQTTCAGREWLR